MVDLKIEGGGREYKAVELLARGDFCDLHVCMVNNQSQRKAVLKITRDKSDNDLLATEARTLRELFASESKYHPYLPKILAAGEIDGRLVNIIPYFPKNVTLTRVIEAHPDGLDFRDMVWMYKRLLTVLGYIHQQGFVHGAVVPPHVMIGPEDHGAKLIDWSYSVKVEAEAEVDDDATPIRRTAWDRMVEDDVFDPAVQHIKAISGPHRRFYPPEVLKKQQPSAATDIYMATKCAEALMDNDLSSLPESLRDIMRSQLRDDPKERSQDAWDLMDLFNETLQKAVGKRRFREFTMPVGG